MNRNGGIRIPLDKGKWRVIFENVDTSLIHFRYDFPLRPQMITTFAVFHGYGFVLDEPLGIRVMVVEPGSEKSINVYAEKVEG